MKATTLLGAALAAVTVSAGVVPRNTTDDGLTEPPQLADLIEQAKSQVMDDVSSTEAKMRKRGETPKCTVSNLVFRRE
jgi:tyrosinase